MRCSSLPLWNPKQYRFLREREWEGAWQGWGEGGREEWKESDAWSRYDAT